MAINTLQQGIDEARLRRALPPPELCRMIRERAGVSQAAVAEGVGVSVPCVSRWETGKRVPRGEQLASYVAILAELQEIM